VSTGGQERSDSGSGTGGQERSDSGSGTGGQERSDSGSGTGGQERSDSGSSPGRLLLGATPLGQPADASRRLIDAFSDADVVAAEDTRRVRALARSLEVTIRGRVFSLFDQNEATRVPALVADIAAGATVLVVSDAGMPLINDPGYRLVAACIEGGLTVSCLPGPSAVTTALAVSGLPSDRFCFEGFAPRKKSARRSWLAELAVEPRTAVFFESPRRLADCLTDAVEQLGPQRRAAVCRELTKTHEEIRRGTLAELAGWAVEGVLGEITVVLAGVIPVADLESLLAEVTALVDGGMRVKDACATVVEAHRGAPSRRELYDAVLRARPGGRDCGDSGDGADQESR
jgi:16S rRNA (cytidine1402-2'-O)-methyltransferase